LLRNALEHTPQPETPITLFAEEGTGGRLRVGVADGGEGIPAMDRRVLKDRIEEPLSHMRGLGLWTVAWLTEAMGGSVEVDDGDDGTTVALVFPASKWERTD
jgi:signal transduction histidine kinase